MNSCSLGALSMRAEGRLRGFLDQWHTMGASAWYAHWLDNIENLRGRVARFVGAEPAHVAMMPSTSVALSVVSESVGPRTGPVGDAASPSSSATVRNRVITTELDFPTLVYQFDVKPEIDLVVLPAGDDGVSVPLDAFREAVDERTLFVATSHVFFTTGFVQDLPALGKIARDAGAYCLIDGYQGAGQVPLDLSSAGVDFYTWGPLKWLCGGPGLAYLWVRPELVTALEPRITSWFATEGQLDFDPVGFRYRSDARRFEMGTPSLPTIHAALGGQEILDEVGPAAVHARNRALTARLVQGCEAAGMSLRIASDPARRSAIVMVRDPNAPATVKRLAEQGMIVDHRPGHVRVSPHFYNTEREIDRAVELLAAAR